jgi:hypothetical protein
MTRYLLSIYQPDGQPPAPEALKPIMDDLAELNAELRTAGAWVFSAGLHPPGTATVLRAQGGALDRRADGELLVTDGPFVEGKEHLGGFTIIEAPDLDAALHWGAKLARAVRVLPVEVRPLQDRTEPDRAEPRG